VFIRSQHIDELGRPLKRAAFLLGTNGGMPMKINVSTSRAGQKVIMQFGD
jgi:hypothetical protein